MKNDKKTKAELIAELEKVRSALNKKEKITGSDNLLQLPDYLLMFNSPVFVKTVEGIFIDCNEAFAAFHSLSKDEIIGKTLMELAPPKLVDKYYQADLALIESKKPQTYSARVLDGAGSYRDIIFQTSLIFDEKKNVAGIIGIMTDVTFQREKEFELKKSFEDREKSKREEYEKLLTDYEQLKMQTDKSMTEQRTLYSYIESSQDWEYWIDEDMSIKYMNDAAERDSGYKAQEFITDQDLLEKIIHPDDMSRWKEHSERIAASIEYHTLEFRILSKDKSVKWVRHCCSPLYRPDGSVLGRRVSNRMITEEIETSEALRKVNHVLKDTEDLVIVFDTGGVIEYVNPAFLLYSGYAQDEITGSNFFDLNAIYRKPEEYEELRKTLMGGEQWKGEVETRSKKGNSYYELRTISPIRNTEGNITHYVSTGKNINERKHALAILTEKEKLYRKMFNKLSVVKLLIDAKSGSIVDANDEACTFYGFERRTLSLMQIGDLSMQDNDELLLVFRETLQKKKHYLTGVHKRVTDEQRNVEMYLSELNMEGREIFYLEIHDITERVKAEQENRELRLFLESIIDNSAVLLTVLDRRGIPIIWNRAAEKLSGHNRENILHSKRNFKKLFKQKQTTDEFFQFLKNAVEGKSFVNKKFITVTKKGEEKTVNLFPSAIIDQDGEQIATLIAGIDMTRLKMMEEELQQSRLLFEIFADNFPGGLFIKDKSSRLVFANRYMKEVLGSEKWMNKKPEEYLPADMARNMVSNEKNVLKTHRSQIDQITMETLEGERKNYQVSKFPIRSDEKKAFIGGVAIDITELKNIEQSLRESEERYQMAVKAGRLAVWQVNLQTGEYSRAPNKNVILGIDETKEAHKVKGLMDYVYKEDRQRLLRLFDQAAKGLVREMNFEFRMYDSKEGYRWLNSLASVYDDKNGKPLLLIGTSTDITDRKLAEFALKASEKRYRKIFENANVGIAMSDLNGNFLFTNEVLQRMLGYSAAELQSVKYAELSHPEDFKKEEELIKKLIEGKENYFHIDKKMVSKEGRTLWCNISVSPISNDFGAVESILSIILDITDSRERASEIAYQARLINSVNDAILSTDAQGKITFWNNGAEKLYGWSAGEALGMPSKLLSENTLSHDKESEIDESISRKGEWKGELLHTNRSGRKFEVDASVTELKDSFGERLGLLSINRDISQRKRVEEALRDSRQMLRHIMDNIPQAVFWKDLDARYIGCNERFAQDIGLDSPDDIIGKDDFALPSLENAETLRIYDDDAKAGVSILNYEERMTKANRETIWIRTSKMPLRNANGSIVAILGVYEDITARKEAEEKSAQYTEELKELNANKDRFFTIIGHDLRTPFNSMLGLAQLISEEHDELSKDELRGFAEKIFVSAKNVFGLLNNMLQWARMQAGRIDYNPEKINLRDSVFSAMELFQASVAEKKVAIQISIPAEINVLTNRNILDTIFRNLISNAIKFSYEGGKIEISADADEEMILTTVRDYGIGIKKDVVEKIFVRGENISTADVSNEVGTGLGLLLCKEFIEKSGGSLTVNAEDAGSRFVFTLPKAEASETG